jgi:hypothetical protein
MEENGILSMPEKYGKRKKMIWFRYLVKNADLLSMLISSFRNAQNSVQIIANPPIVGMLV